MEIEVGATLRKKKREKSQPVINNITAPKNVLHIKYSLKNF